MLVEEYGDGNLLRVGSYEYFHTSILADGNWENVGNPTYPYHYNNTLLNALLRCENLSPRIDLLALVGRSVSNDSDKTRSYFGHKPRNVNPPHLNSVISVSEFASTLKHFLTDWDFRPNALPKGESPVHHSNIFGNVLSGSRDRHFYRNPDSYDGSSAKYLGATLRSGPGGYYFERSWYYYPAIAPQSYLYTFCRDNIQAINNHGWDGFGSPGVSSIFWDFHYSTTDDLSVTILYFKFANGAYGNPSDGLSQFLWYKEHLVRIEYRWEFVPDYWNEDVSYSIGGRRVAECWTRYSSAITKSYARKLGDPVVYSVNRTLSPFAPYTSFDISDEQWTITSLAQDLSSDRFPSFIGYDPISLRPVSFEGPRTFSRFHLEATNLSRDSYSLNFLSQKDAVDKHFERMGSNHIEFALELADLVRPLDIAKAIPALAKYKGGKFPFLLRLLDLLTDAYLTYSLGVAPLLSDAKDVADKLPSFINRFSREFCSPVTINGKYVYQDEERFFPSFPDTCITARSQLRLRIHPDSLLTVVLPVRSLGLLPSLSNLWDIIPFSFIVDYFFNIGSSLDSVDTSILLQGFEVSYSLHSLSTEYRFSSEDEENNHFTIRDGPSDIGAGYRQYSRYIITGVLPILPTRLPIYISWQHPNWGVLSSILYKFIRI